MIHGMRKFVAPLMSVLLVVACGTEPSETSTTSADSGTTQTPTATDTGSSGEPVAPTTSGNGGSFDTTAASESSGAADSTTGAGDTGEASDPQQVILETYAPRVWFTAEEEYWPSSVEWAFDYLERFADGDGRYWVRSIEGLDSPSDTLPFFAGELESAPMYSYWADKGDGIVDLVYFMYYPYNRGKSVVSTIWGNHVGDWEHITVRLRQSDDGSYVPTEVYLSAHSFGGAYEWGSGEVELFEGTHPVVYAATGSHGLWSQPGDHVYFSVGETDPVFDVCITLVCVDLVDETAADIPWDSWESVHGLDFFGEQGFDGVAWPSWMDDNFTDAGAGDPSEPGMGPIYRWGNPEDCSVLGIPIDITDLIGVCRLEDGPTGPVSKSTWGPDLR